MGVAESLGVLGLLVEVDEISGLHDYMFGMPKSGRAVRWAGYAAFAPGLAIVYFHNRWTGGWSVVVTVMGWLSLIVGLIRMIFPMQIAAMASKLAPAPGGMLIAIGVVFLLIGGFLSFKAYIRD